MRFVAYAATALFVLATLAGCAAAPRDSVAELPPPEEPPCLERSEVHQFLAEAGAKPYAGGRTAGGPFVIFVDKHGRWVALGYPTGWPDRVCMLAQGGEWVGPYVGES